MVRCIMLLSICVLAALPYQPSSAQEAKNAASVEELTAMLKSIEPYRHDDEVEGKVAVFGSTSMDAMAHGWRSGFKQFHKAAKVEISAAGSEATFEQLLKTPTGVGMLSRPVKDEELVALKKKGLKNPIAFVVAREALGVFVHSSNPVQSISGEQLRTVFTTDGAPSELHWNALGATGPWSSKPVEVVSRTPNSGTQKFLAEFVFQSATLREGISAHVSNADVLVAVSKNPESIAICGLRSTGKSVKSLQLMDGASVVPSDDYAVLSGQYPLTRPLTVILDVGQTSPDARASQEFVKYALCQAGQTQAILVGFFPVDLPLLRAGLQRLDAAQLR